MVDPRKALAVAVLALLALSACHRAEDPIPVSQFEQLKSDTRVKTPSAYPIAIDPLKVGTYSPNTKSGGGYFYDDVLEYRVWLCVHNGAEDLNDGSDYYYAFAQWEYANEFSKSKKGAEEPLALVRQREWIEEPQPGHYIPHKDERVTEWQVKWLANDKRGSDSISGFLKHPKPAQ
jgi:putative acetyltransferase